MQVIKHDAAELAPAARALSLGRGQAGSIAAAVAGYRHLFDELGIPATAVARRALACHEALARWAPELADEVDRVAHAADLPPADLHLLGARTEIAALGHLVGGECSTLVRADGPRSFGVQTWDWLAAAAPTGIVVTYRSPVGQLVRTFTEPGILAKIGVNSAGLALHFNILAHRLDATDPADADRGGVPVHAVARRLLDESASVVDAAELARSARTVASTVLTVVGFERGSGRADAAAIELSPAGVGVVAADAEGWVVHANHFLDPALADGEAAEPDATSPARQGHLEAARAEDLGSLSFLELCERIGAPGPGQSSAPICVRHDPAEVPTERWDTLLTIRTDPVRCRLDWFAGPPDAAPAHQ